MTYKNRNSYIALGVISGLAILIATLSSGKTSHTQGDAVETLEASSIQVNDKKETFASDDLQTEVVDITPQPSKNDTDPSLTLFLDKNKQTSSDKMIENYNELISASEQHQGSGIVPESIRSSSVQVLTIPFGDSNPEEKDKK